MNFQFLKKKSDELWSDMMSSSFHKASIIGYYLLYIREIN